MHGEGVAADETVLFDYKIDPDAEGSLLQHLGLLDTSELEHHAHLHVLPLPDGIEYTWRGVGRAADGSAWLLGTDGALHHIDVNSEEITESCPVIEAWDGPSEWQEAHPALLIDGETAIVTEPGANAVHRIDLTTGEVLTTGTIAGAPNELALVR